MATSAAKIESGNQVANRGTKFSTPNSSLSIEDELDGREKSLFEELKKKTVSELVQEGVGLIQEAKKATAYYKAVAAVVVAIRAKHKATKKRVGRKMETLPTSDRSKIPDWNQTSEGANAAVTRMYEEAGAGNAQSPVRKAIQYHVNLLVREVATEAQLTKLGENPTPRGAARKAGGATKQTAGSTTTGKDKQPSVNLLDPVLSMQEVIESLNESLKILAYQKEATDKKGIADDEARLNVVKMAETAAKVATEIAEMATALSMRHQGRQSETPKKATAIKKAS